MLVFGLVIFTSAFLLFQVQLIISRYLLPWFGGAANVWNTSMLFFQAMLVVGYCYAHVLTAKSRSRKMLVSLHLGVVGSALAVLLWQLLAWGIPILPGEGLRSTGPSAPAARVLLVLLMSAGIPFFVLSSTSTLIQVWFSAIWNQESPYRLYALSNAGSLLALLTYPFVAEPLFGLRWQAALWSGFFLGYCLLYSVAALLYLKRARPAGITVAEDDTPPTALVRTLWIILPAIGSILLLATTNKITEKIAVLPLFWVLPLATYLVTYIMAFDGRCYGKQTRVWVVLTTFALIFLTLVSIFGGGNAIDESLLLGIYLFVLFIACMHCHGELHRLKPATTHLTSFYLSIALGGALGGLTVSLLAPMVFNRIWEYLLGFLGCAVFISISKLVAEPTTGGNRNTGWVAGGAAAAIILCLAAWETTDADQIVHRGRNFYGTYLIRESAVVGRRDNEMIRLRARKLVHGNTTHGVQVEGERYGKKATTYFGDNSGVGLVLSCHPGARANADERFRIGVIGLGVGTIAAYGNTNHVYRFYEIDADIVGLSAGPAPRFSYVADSAAEVEMVVGDARISIGQEIQKGLLNPYDVLVLDAFSGDHVPTHLLTLEAFQLYRQVLKPTGIIAIHYSSRAFFLEPLIITQAIESGLGYIEYESNQDPEDELLYGSDWMILCEDPDRLNYFSKRRKPTKPGLAYARVKPWTDDLSNPLQLLIINGSPRFFKLFAHSVRDSGQSVDP